MEDKYPGHHTLGGVATAFEATDAENLFVIGVDMPFLSLVVLDRMVEAQGVAQVVVPILNGKDICLHAIYNRKLLPIMKEKSQPVKNCFIPSTKKYRFYNYH